MPLRIRRPRRRRPVPRPREEATTTVSIRLPVALLDDLGKVAEGVEDLTRNGLMVTLLEAACAKAKREGVTVLPPADATSSNSTTREGLETEPPGSKTSH